MDSSSSQVELKTMELVFAASLLSIQQGVRANTGQLGIRDNMSRWSDISTHKVPSLCQKHFDKLAQIANFMQFLLDKGIVLVVFGADCKLLFHYKNPN